MKSKRTITILSAFCLAIILTGSFTDEVHAKKKSKKSNNSVSCSHTCAFNATKSGFTYTGSMTAKYTRKGSCSWPSWGCSLLYNETIARISPNALSATWGVGCGNVHSYKARIVSRPPKAVPTNVGGGGGGCSAGQFYCDATGQCLANGAECNQPPGYEPFTINPEIPAAVGPVKLKDNLVGRPPIVNPGGTCVIDWSNEFESYDKLTICRFEAPGVTVDFAPGDETASTSASIINVQNDTPYKLTCRESDGLTPPEESEGVCRLNWAYKEIN